MNDSTLIVDATHRDGFLILVTAEPLGVTPNEHYALWEPTREKPGETVALPYPSPGEPRHWRHAGYTPEELADRYAENGIRHPLTKAYRSMQYELLHYLRGGMYRLTATVYTGHDELASESWLAEWSDWMKDNRGLPLTSQEAAKRCASTVFDYGRLVQESLEILDAKTTA